MFTSLTFLNKRFTFLMAWTAILWKKMKLGSSYIQPTFWQVFDHLIVELHSLTRMPSLVFYLNFQVNFIAKKKPLIKYEFFIWRIVVLYVSSTLDESKFVFDWEFQPKQIRTHTPIALRWPFNCKILLCM